MNKILLLSASILLILPSLLYSANSGTPIGANGVSIDRGEELKWEEGYRDYFVMFKSLLENNEMQKDAFGNPSELEEKRNPQGDTIMESSTYLLADGYIPEDAYVERAFLIWTGSQSEKDFDIPTDNSVTFKFSSNINPEIDISREISTEKLYKIGDPNSFEFESIMNIANPQNVSDYDYGFFTYRVDITDFFHEIHELSREQGIFPDGLGLLGEYSLRGLKCGSSDTYVERSTLVCGWSVAVVYNSEAEGMTQNKIYIYNGFNDYSHSSGEIKASGFRLPLEAELRVSIATMEGDPGLVNISTSGGSRNKEALLFRGDDTLSWQNIHNRCNPEKRESPMVGDPLTYTELYNSISSFYRWDSSKPECIGGRFEDGELVPDVSGMPPDVSDNVEYGMDVDTFIISAKNYPGHFTEEQQELFFKVSANQDMVLSNFMIVAIDTKALDFDIPGNTKKARQELSVCSCADRESSFCKETPFYYTIKIQNWGKDVAKNISVSDPLPPEVEYIQGTTEIKQRIDGQTSTWETISDIENSFPLEEDGYKLSNITMRPCSFATREDCDSAWIRFKVRPEKALPEHTVIENIATIKDNSGVLYRTNTDIPLRIKISECPSISECYEADLSKCGGAATVEGSSSEIGESGENEVSSETTEEKSALKYETSGCSTILF